MASDGSYLDARADIRTIKYRGALTIQTLWRSRRASLPYLKGFAHFADPFRCPKYLIPGAP